MEGSPIPLLGPHQPFSVEAKAPAATDEDAVSALGNQFLQLLVNASDRGHSSNAMMHALASGQSDDIHGTMIEMTKAGVETRLMVNVKDKVQEAFYELWRMSV